MAPPTQQYKQGSVTCEGLCLSLVASPAFVTFSPSFFVSLLPFYDMTLWGKTHIFGIPLCPLPKIRITLPLSTDACEKILFFACLFCSASPPPPPHSPSNWGTVFPLPFLAFLLRFNEREKGCFLSECCVEQWRNHFQSAHSGTAGKNGLGLGLWDWEVDWPQITAGERDKRREELQSWGAGSEKGKRQGCQVSGSGRAVEILYLRINQYTCDQMCYQRLPECGLGPSHLHSQWANFTFCYCYFHFCVIGNETTIFILWCCAIKGYRSIKLTKLDFREQMLSWQVRNMVWSVSEHVSTIVRVSFLRPTA